MKGNAIRKSIWLFKGNEFAINIVLSFKVKLRYK